MNSLQDIVFSIEFNDISWQLVVKTTFLQVQLFVIGFIIISCSVFLIRLFKTESIQKRAP